MSDIPTAISKVPTNANALSQAGFRLALRRAPMVNFFSQKVNLPGISITETEHPTPFVRIPLSGEHIAYEPLVVTFKVDEDLRNWLEIYNWMKGLGFPNSFDEYKALASGDVVIGEGIDSEVSLFILSSHRNPIFEVTFRNAFPVSLTGIEFDTTLSDVQYVEATAIFQYVSYKIEAVT